MSDTDERRADRRLVIVRHAKAAADTGGSDRARPLTGRGRRDAAAGGAWLARQVSQVDAVWCSSARRARETWEAMAADLPGAPLPDLRDDLYDAGPDDALEMVQEAPDDVRVLVLVGHNPTMERLSAWLTDDDRNFPTGALAVAELAAPWADASPGCARLVGFEVPRPG